MTDPFKFPSLCCFKATFFYSRLKPTVTEVVAAYRNLCTNWVRVEPFKTNKVTAELNYKPHSFIDTSTDDSRSHLHKSSLPQTLSQPKAAALLWIV